ncbi:Ff.00g094780.m01.CDS01 [Fusarium sp. VM40]|nr:Ff.00g094780.m01.CDS01 [Fusarium sp. VM40]
MCKYIHFRYEQCNHQIFDRCEPCWKDYWEAFCPFFPVPTLLCPNGHEHRQSEVFVTKPGKCRTCTKREKEASRRDYGGFTAQAARGVGSSEEAGQAQMPEVPAKTRRSRGYQASSQMNMAPQERESPQFDRTLSHGNSRASTRHNRHRRLANQRSGQPEQRNPYFERPRLERRNAVRVRQVGNKVIMDRLPRRPPSPETERYYQVNPAPEGHVPEHDVIDRSWTVSPLTDDDIRAPYVEIPLEDEYGAPF